MKVGLPWPFVTLEEYGERYKAHNCIRHSLFLYTDLGMVEVNQGYGRLMLGFLDMEQSHDQLSWLKRNVLRI